MPFDPTSYAAPVQPKVDPDAEVLLRAAEIAAAKWSKPGPCIMMCMGMAAGDPSGHHTRAQAQLLGFEQMYDAWAWNDAPGRTAAEVIARLREAAHAR